MRGPQKTLAFFGDPDLAPTKEEHGWTPPWPLTPKICMGGATSLRMDKRAKISPHCVRIESSSITISAAATVAAVPTRYRHMGPRAGRVTIAIILATISRLELAGIESFCICW